MILLTNDCAVNGSHWLGIQYHHLNFRLMFYVVVSEKTYLTSHKSKSGAFDAEWIIIFNNAFDKW